MNKHIFRIILLCIFSYLFLFHAQPVNAATLPGDLNNDYKVDSSDYNILVAEFGKTGSPGWIPADIDNNGKVDIFDYNILVRNFGTTQPAKFDMSGNPFFIRMEQTIGTLIAGKVYIYYHDPQTSIDHLEDFGGTKISASNNPYYASGMRVLWGAPLYYDGNACLESSSTCVATVVGPVFSPDVPALRGQFDTFLQSVSINVLRGIQEAGPATSTQYLAERSLANTLRDAARAYPYVYTTEMKTNLTTLLQSASQALMSKTAEHYIHSSYTIVYGTTAEFQTLSSVVKGLAEWKRVYPSAALAINAYFASVSPSLTANGYENLLKIRNGSGVFISYPNAFGQYFTTTVALDQTGIAALNDSLARDAILFLRDTQTVQTAQSMCFGTKVQVYGGWPHEGFPSTGDNCTQNMGYHNLIVSGLLSLNDLITDTNGACRNGWENTCSLIKTQLKNALAWILNVQDPSTYIIFDRAPGSSASTPTPWGTVTGISAAARILSALHKGGSSSQERLQTGFNGSTLSLDEAHGRIIKAIQSPFPGTPLFIGSYLDYSTSLKHLFN